MAKDESIFTLRMPRDVRDAVEQIAKGDGTRPEASLNTTIIFLLRYALESLQRDDRSAGGRP